jgi:hypothetical protein
LIYRSLERQGGESLKATSGRIAQSRDVAVAIIATLAVLALRLWMGRQVTFCGDPDSCAYLALGQSLSHHHGLALNFLYQYQFVNLHLPTTGLEYWRPGVSFLLLLAQPFGGVTLGSSVVITTLAGIVLALAAWKIAMDFSGDRRIACASYLLCLLLPDLWNSSLTPDSTLFYGAFAAWFLALFTVRFQGYVADAVALLCVVAVDLIRNDSILLVVPLLVVLWLRRRSGQKQGASVLYAAVIVVGYLATRLPLQLVNYVVAGKVVHAQTSQVLYLTNLSELLQYNQPSTLHTMLAAGIVALVKLRITTIPFIVYRLAFVEIGFGLVFLFALSLRRREGVQPSFPELAGGVSFGLTVVGVYGLVIPAVGISSSLRSFVAVLPLICVLIVWSVYQANSAEIARRLMIAVLVFYAIEGLMDDRRTVTNRNLQGDQDRLVAAYLAQHGVMPGQGSLIMTADPAQFSATTDYSAIPLPSNGVPATQQAVHDLGPTEIVLEEGSAEMQMRDALHPASVAIIPNTQMVVLTMAARR